ncbi:uncharacterized protein LOC142586872 [Dermacentor variabilis]|uniref:uncharacterized protein LOC142586872 n=1 Tax=Dermacentor variabilis TaxID=34621 RepID=UPI003F5B5A68
MAKALKIALTLVVLRSPPPCSSTEPAGPKWLSVEVKNNEKLKTLAQDALRHMKSNVDRHYVVVEMLSAETMKMNEASAAKYNVTYKASPTSCLSSAVFDEATCKPLAEKAEKQCSTTFFEIPAEEFYQIQKMECFEIYYEK